MGKRKDMISINAIFSRKESSFNTSPCIIEKTIILSDTEYDNYRNNMLKDYSFISENNDNMYVDTNGTTHCILVIGEDRDDGILINSENFDYARYTAFIPNARLFIKNQENIQEYEKSKTLNFYCPLTINTDEDSDELYELDPIYAVPYIEQINNEIDKLNKKAFKTDKGLMEYFDEDDNVKQKVISYLPTNVIEHNDVLYGVIEVKIIEKLTEHELDIFKANICGQLSDGYGEIFEQKPIPYEDGNLYVSFWNSTNDYFIKTQAEFEEYLSEPTQAQGYNISMGL